MLRGDWWVTSTTWGPLPPCKQALRLLHSLKKAQMMGDFTVFSTAAVTIPVCANCAAGRDRAKSLNLSLGALVLPDVNF